MNKPKIGIVGTGNMAMYLDKAFTAAGVPIQFFASRNPKADRPLSPQIPIAELANHHVDFLLIATPDNNIYDWSQEVSTDTILAHTSGATPLSAIASKAANTGVFYPLQSFLKGDIDTTRDIPILVEGSNKQSEDKLLQLAQLISFNHQKANTEQRLIAHLSAVVANNFITHLGNEAATLLEKHNLPQNLLYPLYRKTFDRLQHDGFQSELTGPAARGDQKTIEQHLGVLSEDPQLMELYLAVTKSIID